MTFNGRLANGNV